MSVYKIKAGIIETETGREIKALVHKENGCSTAVFFDEESKRYIVRNQAESGTITVVSYSDEGFKALAIMAAKTLEKNGKLNEEGGYDENIS